FEEDGKEVAKCKHFPKVLTRSSKNGTTHLKQIKETCVRDQGSLSSTHWFISFSFLENGYHEMYSILHKFWESIEHVTETTHGRLKFQEVVDQVKLQCWKS
ncbi:hypothetical protein Godav_019799, partial [Gossypium davidsonii]|nr:hypothetical protein [Gossypium davidsonii]